MFTRVELTDWNTPRLFLMFYIHLHLLSIAFWKLWFNLTMESFKSSCIWKHPLFCWWFSSKTEVKNNDYYVQILFYLLIFSHCFLKSNQISSGIIYLFLHILWKLLFPRSDTRPTQVMGLLPDTQNCGCACVGNAGNVFPVTAVKRSRHASRHVRHARAVMHAGIAN